MYLLVDQGGKPLFTYFEVNHLKHLLRTCCESVHLVFKFYDWINYKFYFKRNNRHV